MSEVKCGRENVASLLLSCDESGVLRKKRIKGSRAALKLLIAIKNSQRLVQEKFLQFPSENPREKRLIAFNRDSYHERTQNEWIYRHGKQPVSVSVISATYSRSGHETGAAAVLGMPPSIICFRFIASMLDIGWYRRILGPLHKNFTQLCILCIVWLGNLNQSERRKSTRLENRMMSGKIDGRCQEEFFR